ncbi:U32 family peptidase [Nanoarchaeota archaeon]
MAKENKVEIMAPVGNFASLTAAVNAGADSVYFGVQSLNMRSLGAKNFTLEDLGEIVKICDEKDVKTYLTVNAVLYDEDLDLMKKIIDAAKKASISAVIASDIAAIKYANSIGVEVHSSTQLNISNIEAIKFYSKFTDVIVLARELNLEQIKNICEEIKKQDIRGPKGKLVKIEIFIHGALCVSISGKCYMSLALYNKSANRGECLQACRRSYKVTDEQTGNELSIENKYVMSPKDLCCISFLDQILKSGVSVLKIEGRARSPEYVDTVVKTYREAVDSYYEGSYTEKKVKRWIKDLERVFNRGFWQGGYYLGKKLGEWSKGPGSKATMTKKFIGKAQNYFVKTKIAQFYMNNGPLKIGDTIMIIGPTTGVLKTKIKGMYVEEKPVDEAKQGDEITIPIEKRVRESDELYLIEDKTL